MHNQTFLVEVNDWKGTIDLTVQNTFDSFKAQVRLFQNALVEGKITEYGKNENNTTLNDVSTK